MSYLNSFFFDICPYITFVVFVVGCWVRYDYGQYTWKAGSSQMLSKKGTGLAMNLFHIGAVLLIFGHIIGLLTPHSLYAPILSVQTKQVLEMIFGGIFGLLALIGSIMLFIRRLKDDRIRETSTKMDVIIIFLLVIQILLGELTIPVSMNYLDGSEMLKLTSWAQQIFIFKFGASSHLEGVSIIFKIHIVLGMLIFILAPFSRLVHIWSVPLEYLSRKYQIVRKQK